MSNRAIEANHYHSKSASTLIEATHWVADKLEIHHAHKEFDHEVKRLQSLDRHMLEDMGIDIEALFDRHPQILRKKSAAPES